ncbi:hypothetical protein [Thiococcus pfennigii]|uniref:hypothetical protein n=1 Tax=Thiococcus pfennigii TaxID=1057 RepID=UPI0019046D99|nr:hypothetical protein [Thiococcus pfennigii]MBK1699736.1 hypothetical protein [Thiococcus pfennigii]
MIRETVVHLPRSRLARIRVARVEEVARLLDLLPAEADGGDLLALARTHFTAILVTLQDSVALPDGERLTDLPLDEAEALLVAWWELHRDFFVRALTALGLTLEGEPPKPAPGSSRPVSSSASAATSTPGAGAGTSSRPH